MKKRFLPIPLILLTPILLLIIVIAAGVYRFSLSDEEILNKFPQTRVEVNAIAQQVFELRLTNPITVPVPDSPSVAFMQRWDQQQRWILGNYDTGRERGVVAVDTQRIIPLREKVYVSIVTISNQSDERLYYLALFKFDEQRSRMTMVQSELLGDRIEVQSLEHSENQIEVTFLTHTKNQAFSESPADSASILFSITEKYQLVRN